MKLCFYGQIEADTRQEIKTMNMINAYYASMFSPLHFDSTREAFIVQYMGYAERDEGDYTAFGVGPSYSVLIIF